MGCTIMDHYDTGLVGGWIGLFLLFNSFVYLIFLSN